jgi:hypothetical protein
MTVEEIESLEEVERILVLEEEFPTQLRANSSGSAGPHHSPAAKFSEWRRFALYPNPVAAHIVAERLRTDGVPAYVATMGTYPDADNAEIWVPRQLLHRARWVLAWAPPTDAELTFLATGELPGDGGAG